MPICIYPPSAEDFSNNGLGILTPLECTVEEVAAGKYELELVHPIDNTLRWMQIAVGYIIKAPSPKRENPMYEYMADIEANEDVTVSRQIYEAGANTFLYQKPEANAATLCRLPARTRLVLLEYSGGLLAKVALVNGGQVGWCYYNTIKFVETSTEVINQSNVVGQRVVQLQQSRDQLFRIYSVEQDSEAAIVTAKAMHVYYDDSGNLYNTEYEPDNADLSEVMETLEKSLIQPAHISIQALHLKGKITGDFSFKTPVEAYLDPDEGIVKQTGALLVRDNFDAYLLPDSIRDNGVTVRRGKNLIGVEVTNDISDVVTRIIPVGKNKDGDPIYIYPDPYVDSPHIGDYPFPRTQRIEYDVQTGSEEFKNDNSVRFEILRLAEEDFSVHGVDLPAYGMEVDFVLLQNTAEYANYASLQAVYLYDTVTVIDEMLGLTAKVRVTGYKWDCLAEQYESVTLGELQDVKQTVYSYNLPDGGVSGNKIMNNSMPGTALRNASIEYAKITNAAIDRLSAQAITALTARIQDIAAEKLTTDELYAAYAEMIALKVGTITADNIQTDSLAAELARITVLAAGTAEFDRATIQHLVAAAMNLEYGTAGQVFIKNLAVEYAQMVGATIGELCIKSSDGDYYLLDVGADGSVTATKTTVSDGEINAGQTSGGRVILETSIAAANLNTGNLLATYALVNRIDAARIDVDELFAREAFIGLLRTTQIIGESSIEMIAKRAVNAAKTYRQEDTPLGADGVNPGDLWVIPGTEQVYQAEDAADAAVEFYLGSDGVLYYTSEDNGVEVQMQEYDLYMSGASVNVSSDGEIGAAYRWAHVQDQILAADIIANREAFERVVRIDDDGLHVGDNQTANEVLIDSESVNIVIENQRYSKFAAQYVQFGNYKIGLADDDGLMFKPM